MTLLGGRKKALSFTATDSSRSGRRSSSLANHHRSQSVPCRLSSRRIKGILKFKSVEASLHSTYGGSSSNHSESKAPDGEAGEDIGNSNGRRTITFTEILVREYARTVGDNPSCSSGPPVRYVVSHFPG